MALPASIACSQFSGMWSQTDIITAMRIQVYPWVLWPHGYFISLSPSVYAISAIAESQFTLLMCLESLLLTLPMFDILLAPSRSHSISPPPPTSTLHKLTPLLPSSLATSLCLPEVELNSHRAQEQVNTPKDRIIQRDPSDELEATASARSQRRQQRQRQQHPRQFNTRSRR